MAKDEINLMTSSLEDPQPVDRRERDWKQMPCVSPSYGCKPVWCIPPVPERWKIAPSLQTPRGPCTLGRARPAGDISAHALDARDVNTGSPGEQ